MTGEFADTTLPRTAPLLLACLLVSVAGAAMYRATLLPGVDLGDTGGFQAALAWPSVSARQAYPLYYHLGLAVLAATGHANPAYALNLMSAMFGGLAVGLLTWVTARVTGMTIAGIVAGAWLAVSYTFWTQAIIAEVYTLHLASVGACLAALLAWRHQPTLARLAIFFAVYAAGYGNHLSMVLLLPAFTLYLLSSAPGGPASLLRPRVVALAVVLAAAGALQYAPNLISVGAEPLPPRSWAEALGTFWFEVTKADWRESMVMGVKESELGNRFGMWWFDLRQQVGIPGIAAAAAGAAALWHLRRREATLVTAIWVVNTVFAFTYNVGDTHVFYLPSHYIVALWIGCGAWLVASMPRRGAAPIGAAVLLGLAAWRGYDTWPAVDRHDDDRAAVAASRLASGLPPDAVLGVEVNWQLENALLYHGRWVRPDLAWFRAPESLLQLPWLIHDNAAAGRGVWLTRAAAEAASAAYGTGLTFEADRTSEVESLTSITRRIPGEALYVAAVLHPYPDQPLDPADLESALAILGVPPSALSADAQFTVAVGRRGTPPLLVRVDQHPFRERVRVGALSIDLRMESWLPTDTFRRAGFGRAIVNRRHAATFDRGVTLVWLRGDGSVAERHYRAGLYAPEPRWRTTLGKTP